MRPFSSLPFAHNSLTKQFGNIILGGKNAHREESVGILRLHANGIGWKSKVAGNVVPIAKADLRAAEWPSACAWRRAVRTHVGATERRPRAHRGPRLRRE